MGTIFISGGRTSIRGGGGGGICAAYWRRRRHMRGCQGVKTQMHRLPKFADIADMVDITIAFAAIQAETDR
eukprot:3943194-Heterocapsa_arctica.AAC.1